MKLTISLVLLELLSGCSVISAAALSGLMMGDSFGSPRPQPTKILCTAEDSMGLRYWRVEPNTQHDEAMQIVAEHCGGEYVETKRVDTASYSTVYTMCLQEDGSPPVSPSCKYVENESEYISKSASKYDYKVKTAQEILKALNYYKQEPDGYWNDETKLAVIEYQKFKGLRPTGILNDESLNRMRYDYSKIND